MSARLLRAMMVLAFALNPTGLRAQGFGRLGAAAPGFETPRPGTPLIFPKDHGAHRGFRTEWWYLTANLSDAIGAVYGVQWTLFRHALEPDSPREGWSDRNIWMGHAAVTSATQHLFAQTLARGGVGQAGVAHEPFRAWIDDWAFETRDPAAGAGLSRLRIAARGETFAYRLDLASDKPVALQGDKGYSRKSDAGQASYYYSQPFFTVDGTLSIHGKAVKVTGRAWMDREWSSQPLAPDQKGWDWFSLHLASGEKLMLFQLRSESAAKTFVSGNWISPDGATQPLARDDISLEPLTHTRTAGRALPTRWRIRIKSRGLEIETTPINAASWMGTTFPYWEGPIHFTGAQSGVGYLEMMGY